MIIVQADVYPNKEDYKNLRAKYYCHEAIHSNTEHAFRVHPGEVPERSNGAVSKTVEAQTSESSNLSLSALT